MIHHLKDKKIFAARSKGISDIPLLKASNNKSLEERLAIVRTKLHQLGSSKPRALKTFRSTISSLFQKQLAEDELEEIVAVFVTNKWASITNTGKIAFTLPP